MHRTRFAAALLFLLLLHAWPAHAEAPRLVVVLVVDQMRSEYIETYGSRWTKGLRRLLDEGAWLRDAAYPYLNTVTCAGHATIGTGAVPARHGIILNAWYDREQGKVVGCSDDPDAPDIAYGSNVPGGGHSAKRLLVPTLAETLRAARRGRAVTLSLKPRSAIMLAGREADAVTWFSGTGWATSRAYSEQPVPFVEQYVQAHPVTADLKADWHRLLPPDAYRFADDALGEKPPAGWDRRFEHVLAGASGEADPQFFELWQQSPWSDAYLGQLAAEAVDRLALGRRDAIDFLGVSFSALDMVGHDFGPRSHEVQDTLARLDVTIGALLRHLDERVGRGRYVVALSADHGVADIPEQLLAEGKEAGRLVMEAIVARVNDVLAGALGPGRHVARMDYTNLYFVPGVFDRIAAAPGLLATVMDAIAGVPGVLRVIDSRSLDPARPGNDPVVRAAALNHVPGRSGDLVVVPRPNWFFVADDKTATPGPGATHGTAHPYDARVPVVFMGAGVRAGVYTAEATPADIAPTLARLAGVELPRATGRVLEEVLSPASRTAP